jgi:hypothetical protein
MSRTEVPLSEAIISVNEAQQPPPGNAISKSRASKLRWRKEGRCDNCGQEPEEGKRKCARCGKAAKKASARSREKNGSSRKYYRDRKSAGLCTHCGERPCTATSVNCEVCNEFEWGRRLRIKQEVITKYGGECVCCGEDNVVFLSLDHKDGGGTNERNVSKIMGGRLYRFLRNKPVDSKYQVMCYNCNFAKGDRGTCPHQNMEKIRSALAWSPIPKEKIRRNRVHT